VHERRVEIEGSIGIVMRIPFCVIAMFFIIIFIVAGVWVTNVLAGSRNAGMNLSQQPAKQSEISGEYVGCLVRRQDIRAILSAPQVSNLVQ
jgi:hypothetical protein